MSKKFLCHTKARQEALKSKETLKTAIVDLSSVAACYPSFLVLYGATKAFNRFFSLSNAAMYGP
jgi:short-subunit dehydrogenase